MPMPDHGSTPEESVRSLRQALVLQPGNAAIHCKLSHALHAAGHADEAIRHYREAIRIRPGFMEATVALGNLLAETSRSAEALEVFSRAAMLEPANAGIHYSIGNAHAALGSYPEAAESYKAAVRLQPGFRPARANLGVALRHCGQFEEAFAAFDSADTPDSRPAALLCLLELKQYERFFALVSRYAQGNDMNRSVAAISAYAAQQLGHRDPHGFCPDPFRYIREIDNPGDVEDQEEFMSALTHAVRSLATVYEPGHVTTKKGYQTVGINLFKDPRGPVAVLETALRAEIAAYYEAIRSDDIGYARLWPEISHLTGWYVRPVRGGYQRAHNHPAGWLSGVIYLSVPPEAADSEAGRIEFVLKADEYPEIADAGPRMILEPRPGKMVLFPSSLYHRTIPFDSSDERLCIAFDYRPAA